jgi:hypothetical protein
MNLLQRINEVRKAIDYIKKDKAVSTGSSGNYMAVTHDMVTAMVRPHMIAQGIVCIPSLVHGETIQPPPKADGKERQLRYEATYDFTFASIEDPKDTIIIRMQSHANDSGDKAPGKAISYAKKYAILKLFEIETGEDEESRNRDEGYGLDENRKTDLLTLINEASTMDALKSASKQATQACSEVNDATAYAELTDAYKARKTALEKK